MELTKTMKLLLIIIPSIALCLWNMIYIVKKAHEEGKKEREKTALRLHGERLRKEIMHKHFNTFNHVKNIN